MKKVILLVVMLSLGLGLMTGCSGVPVSEAEEVAAQISVDLEIREKLFVAQMNDIYINTDDFLGKTIKYEGMFAREYYELTDSYFNMVFRFGPGCCGTDGVVGLEVAWDEEKEDELPSDNDWVEVIGVVEEYEELGNIYLRLNILSLRVLSKRGAETVLQ